VEALREDLHRLNEVSVAQVSSGMVMVVVVSTALDRWNEQWEGEGLVFVQVMIYE